MTYARLTYARIAYSIECLRPGDLRPADLRPNRLFHRMSTAVRPARVRGAVPAVLSSKDLPIHYAG